MPHALHDSTAYAVLITSAAERDQRFTPAAFDNIDVTASEIRGAGSCMVMTPDACVEMYQQLSPDAMVVVFPLLSASTLT